MKIIIIIIIFYVSVGLAASKNIIIPIQVVDSQGVDFVNKLSIGVSSEASYGIDSAFGELELMPGKPPGKVNMCALKIEEIDQSNGLKLWSNKDIRPKTEEDKQFQKYHIIMYYFQKDLLMSLDFKDNDVDSIIVTDIDNGSFFIENISQTKELFWDNENLERVEFYIHVFYNLVPSSVENSDKENIIRYSNSRLFSNAGLKDVSIFNSLGKPVYHNGSLVREIDLSGFHSGVYFLRAESEKRLINKKIIISR